MHSFSLTLPFNLPPHRCSPGLNIILHHFALSITTALRRRSSPSLILSIPSYLPFPNFTSTSSKSVLLRSRTCITRLPELYLTSVLKLLFLQFPSTSFHRLQLQERPPPIPYLYHTPHAPSSVDVDLRIWNKDLMSRAIPILTAITYKEPKGWYTQYRSRLVAELKGLGFTDAEITIQVRVIGGWGWCSG